MNPRAAEHIADAAARLWELDAGLEELTERYLRRVSVQPGRVTARLGDLAEVPEFLLPRVLLGMLDLLAQDARMWEPFIWRRSAACGPITETTPGISLPHGVTARLASSRLMLETLPQPLFRAELVKDCPLRWGDYTLTLMDRREGAGLALAPGPDWETVAVAPCDPAERMTLPETNGGGRTVKRLCLDPAHFSGGAGPPARHLCGKPSGRRVAAGVHTEFLPEGEACRFIQINETEESSQ